MSIKTIVICCVTVSVLAVGSSAAYAQRPLRRYQPPGGPTLSPYLNLNRPDFSTLPSAYDSFLVPQQRLQRNLYDLGQTQQANTRRIEGEISQVRSSVAAPTGVGSGFMNYSHYYRMQPSMRASK